MERKPVFDRGVGKDDAPESRPRHGRGGPTAPDYRDVPRLTAGASSLTRRASPRRVLPCRALVRIGDSYRMARTVHDISLVGLFVELDIADLALGELVEVVLEFDNEGRATELQLAAEVGRLDDSGVGLRFCACGDQTYTELVNALYAR